MKRVVFLIVLALMVPSLALAGVNQTFEAYADNAAWQADSMGGWILTGVADFQVADNILRDTVNSSDKVFHITSPTGTPGGNLQLNFAPISSGSFSFNVYSPITEGSLNYAGWTMGGVNPTLFHGMFYEYMNDAYFQYGNSEPYGGFEQQSVGVLSGAWHTVSGNWTADGRLSMAYDGVVKISNVPMRNDIGDGLSYLMFYTPDGSGTNFYGSDVYIDNITIASTVVPEPSALIALGSGLVGMAGLKIRRRK